MNLILRSEFIFTLQIKECFLLFRNLKKRVSHLMLYMLKENRYISEICIVFLRIEAIENLKGIGAYFYSNEFSMES